MLRAISNKIRKNFNILLVDDSLAILELLAMRLEENKRFSVKKAIDGFDAMSQVQKTKFDLILTDMMMPKFDGMWLLEELQKAKSKIPIIVMSGKVSVNDSIQVHKLGAKIYITKPIDFRKLDREIGRILEHSHLRNEKHYETKSIFNAINGTISDFLSDDNRDCEFISQDQGQVLLK